MEINFKFEKQKIIKLYAKCAVETQYYKEQITKWRIIFAIFSVVALIVDHSIKNIVFYLCANLFVTPLSKFVGRFFYKLSIWKTLNTEDFKYMFNNIKLTLKEDMLEYKTDISNTNFIYTSIDSIICISNHIFIVLKNKKSILVPKTAFKNNEEINTFIEFLKDKTNISVMNTFPDDINFI